MKKNGMKPVNRDSKAKRSPTRKRLDLLLAERAQAGEENEHLMIPGKSPKAYAVHVASARQSELQQAMVVLRSALREHPNDLWKQFKYFFSHFEIPAAIGEEREVSFKTKALYIEHIQYFIKELKKANIKPRNLTELSLRNFKLCIRRWEEQGLSAPSLTNRWSNGFRFLRWMGHSGPYISVLDIVVRRESAICKTSATESKEWARKGYDVEALIAEVETYCPVTAVRLRLESAFGLRTNEALCLKPREAHKENFLHLDRGTKGGLKRVVRIEAALQRDVLEQAKAMTHERSGLLGRPGQSLKQARNHYYYVLRKFGITRKDKGITAHGLRHGYANDRFEVLTGSPAPVNGGVHLPRSVEMAARKTISQELGHQRIQITARYTGSVRHVRSTRTRSQSKLLAMIQCESVLIALNAQQAELAQTSLQLALFVVGPEAEGLMVKPGAALRMCVSIAGQNVSTSVELAAPAGQHAEIHRAIDLLSPVLKAATQRHVEIVDLRMVALSGADTPLLKVF